MMKITDVKVQSFRQPVPSMWKVHLGETLDVTLVTVATDEGIEGYAMGRAVGRISAAIHVATSPLEQWLRMLSFRSKVLTN